MHVHIVPNMYVCMDLRVILIQIMIEVKSGQWFADNTK